MFDFDSSSKLYKFCFLIIMIVMFCSCSDHSRELHKLPFPSKTKVRLSLPRSPDERIRQVDYYLPDGLTKEHSIVDYRNGVMEEIEYWDTGSKRESIKYYPAQTETGIRRIRCKALYQRDGKTFVSHVVYRLDGTMERRGRELEDGTYESTYFFNDGLTVERSRKFDRKRRFVGEKLYRRNGTLTAEISPEDAELHISLFNTSEKRTASYFRNKIGEERGTVYAQDGDTIHVIYDRDRLLFQADYYDDKGVLVQHSQKLAGVLQISAIDGEGIFRQEWRDHRSTEGVIRETLNAVEEFGADRKVFRTIQMSGDGRYPVQVEYVSAKGKILNVLDGSSLHILQIEEYDQTGVSISRRKGAPGECEHISAARLEMPLRDALPNFKDFGPARIYDYEEQEHTQSGS